jgi:hypothetical protein
MDHSTLQREAFEAHWQQAAERRCGLIPAQTHCWHEQLTLWSDLFPPEMVCCWCEATTRDMTVVPPKHGPYVPAT